MKESHSVSKINEDIFKSMFKNINSSDDSQDDYEKGINFLYNLYDSETMDLGNYDITYCDDAGEFTDEIQSITKTNDYIKINFGDDYYDGHGGYIIIKSMSLKEFNNFNEVSIDTY